MNSIPSAGPNAPVLIATDYVRPAIVNRAENFPIRNRAVIRDIKNPDMMRDARIRHVKLLLIRRKTNPVRFVEIFDQRRDIGGFGIETVNKISRLFLHFIVSQAVVRADRKSTSLNSSH